MRKKKSFNQNAYKSQVIFMGVLISALTIFFQNCGKIQNSSIPQKDKVTVIGKIQTNEPVRVLGHLDPQDQGRGPILYWIHSNGRIEKSHYENPESTPEQADCSLSRSLLSQLNDSIENSQICFYEADIPEGMMCTLQFVYPYFLVSSDNILYEFGKLTSGCGDTFEMCGRERESFKALIESIALELDQACN